MSLFANPYSIVAAALTAAIHHITFFFFLPDSVFNYNASFYIVLIHAAFVIVESLACIYLSNQFKRVLDLQDKIQVEIKPLVESIDEASRTSSISCSTLLDISGSNSSAITQISTGAERILQMANKTKDKILETLETMKETKSSVADSSNVIKDGEKFLDSLNNIKVQMLELQSLSSGQLQSVVDSVNTISEKTGIINDIVFQTKLLSFNASVEAARAGEHGKGFSVVAEEISTIVNHSREQLKESVDTISSKLTDFQTGLEGAFTSWDDINQRLQGSFKIVERNSKAQESSLDEISASADEQCEGVNELSSALSSIDSSSHKNLEQLREIEAITKRLEEDSKHLNSIQKELGGKSM